MRDCSESGCGFSVWWVSRRSEISVTMREIVSSSISGGATPVCAERDLKLIIEAFFVWFFEFLFPLWES